MRNIKYDFLWYETENLNTLFQRLLEKMLNLDPFDLKSEEQTDRQHDSA